MSKKDKNHKPLIVNKQAKVLPGNLETKNDSIIKKAGRPFGTKKVQSPEKLWEYFQAYQIKVKNDPFTVKDWVGKDAYEVQRPKEKPLTIEGFECYLFDEGIVGDLGNYFANTDNAYSDYLTICSHIRKIVRADQIAGGMAGIYNPSITQRLNGLVEKSEADIKINKPVIIDWSGDSSNSNPQTEGSGSGSQQ